VALGPGPKQTRPDRNVWYSAAPQPPPKTPSPNPRCCPLLLPWTLLPLLLLLLLALTLLALVVLMVLTLSLVAVAAVAVWRVLAWRVPRVPLTLPLTLLPTLPLTLPLILLPTLPLPCATVHPALATALAPAMTIAWVCVACVAWTACLPTARGGGW